MSRKLMIAVIALASAVPSLANNTQIPAAPVPPPQPALRLMNESEFSTFLTRLDTDLARTSQQLKRMDLKSVSPDAGERMELEGSYNRCLESLGNARDEVQKLSQKQTLKLDLYLLIDLNQLSRNLDALDEGLMTPSYVTGSGARKSLLYAREVLNIDGVLAPEISKFQHHFIAFTGVVDASMDQSASDAVESQGQK